MNVDEFGRYLVLAETFVATFVREPTRAAYRVDLLGCGHPVGQCRHRAPQRDHNPVAWLPWCYRRGVDPLTVKGAVIELWLADLAAAGQSDGTRARRLSTASSWYAWLIRQEVIDVNPVVRVDRKKKPKKRASGTAGTALSLEQYRDLLAAADADSPRSGAIVALAGIAGLRESEITDADIEGIGSELGGPVLKYKGKGGKDHRAALPPAVIDRINAYLGIRTDRERLPALTAGARPRRPLFVTSTGNRLTRMYVYRLVRRLAERTGIPGTIAPHDLRRTFGTQAIGAGAPLRDVQQAMGHSRAETTEGYDRNLFDPSRHPAHLLAAKLAEIQAASPVPA